MAAGESPPLILINRPLYITGITLLALGLFVTGMIYQPLYNFFDNGTTAAIFALLLGAFCARGEYRNQKYIDRELEIKKEVSNSISRVQQQADKILLIIDRIAYSSVYRQEHGEVKDWDQTMLDALKHDELPRLSKIEMRIWPQLLPNLIRGLIHIFVIITKSARLIIAIKTM